jgi:hypothetical protein
MREEKEEERRVFGWRRGDERSGWSDKPAFVIVWGLVKLFSFFVARMGLWSKTRGQRREIIR